MEFWVDIKGYNGIYQINGEGEVRSYAGPGTSCKLPRSRLVPRLLKWHIAKDTQHCCVNLFSKRFLVHRLVWETFKGSIPEGYELDHIDRNPMNNAISNLRLATHSQNLCNQRIRRQIKSSKFKGVSWNKQHCKWEAYLYFKTTRTKLGMFSDELSAAKAYNRCAEEIHGIYANTNIIPDEVQ